MKKEKTHLFPPWWLESGGSQCRLCYCLVGSVLPPPSRATPPWWRSPSPSPPWPGPGLLAPAPLRPSPELVPVWWQVGWTRHLGAAKPQTWCATRVVAETAPAANLFLYAEHWAQPILTIGLAHFLYPCFYPAVKWTITSWNFGVILGILVYFEVLWSTLVLWGTLRYRLCNEQL